MLLGTMIDLVDRLPLPPLVVYCGSTSKCAKQFQRAALYDTIRDEPRMFLTIGCTVMSDTKLVQEGVTLDKERLDLLHCQKIAFLARACQTMHLQGEVCILDRTDSGDRYIGASTRNEEYYTKYLMSLDYPLTLRYSQEQEAVRAVLRESILG